MALNVVSSAYVNNPVAGSTVQVIVEPLLVPVAVVVMGVEPPRQKSDKVVVGVTVGRAGMVTTTVFVEVRPHLSVAVNVMVTTESWSICWRWSLEDGLCVTVTKVGSQSERVYPISGI